MIIVIVHREIVSVGIVVMAQFISFASVSASCMIRRDIYASRLLRFAQEVQFLSVCRISCVLPVSLSLSLSLRVTRGPIDTYTPQCGRSTYSERAYDSYARPSPFHMMPTTFCSSKTSGMWIFLSSTSTHANLSIEILRVK